MAADDWVLLLGWTEDDLDHVAEVVATEEAIDDGTVRARVVRPGGRRVEAPAGSREQGAAASSGSTLAVTKQVAADMLSMSIDSLERHVMADLRTVRVGGIVRIPVSELERWVADRAARALEGR